MTTSAYTSDLTDAQWERLDPLILPAKSGGRPRSVNLRAIVNAIFYRTKTDCQWRNLPHDFPPWGTVAGYYRIWRRAGVWGTINDALREQVRIEVDQFIGNRLFTRPAVYRPVPWSST